MSDSESGGSPEPDLATLSRRAAEARLLRDAEQGLGRFGVSEAGLPDTETESGQPPESAEEAILWWAERGASDEVSRLLERDASLVSATDADGYSPLHRAAYNDHVHTAELLVEAGADLAARTCEGWAPLHSAARWNSVSCLTLLLLHGADVNAVTKGGLTPLMLAASNAESRDAWYLLLTTDGVRVDLANDSGDTAVDIGRRSAVMAPLLEIAEPYMTDI